MMFLLVNLMPKENLVTMLIVRLLSKIVKNQPAEVKFVDGNPMLWGRSIGNYGIMDYTEIRAFAPDYVLACPPEQHRTEITTQILNAVGRQTKVMLFADKGTDGTAI
jgi:hypothetical protein